MNWTFANNTLTGVHGSLTKEINILDCHTVEVRKGWDTCNIKIVLTVNTLVEEFDIHTCGNTTIDGISPTDRGHAIALFNNIVLGIPLPVTEVLVYKQNVLNALFINLADLQYKNQASVNPINEDIYSILGDLETYRRSDNNKLRFRLKYLDLGVDVVFEQDTNPFDTIATASGFNLISSNVDADGLAGLARTSTANDTYVLIEGQTLESSWRWSLGAIAVWTGDGSQGVPATKTPKQAAQQIELYVII